MMHRKTRIDESWNPDYDDQPVNQFGEKWQKVSGTWLNSVLDDIIKDVQIDPYEDDPKMESLTLGSLHMCEDGHLIATVYGGANGGGLRGHDESNWKFYLSLVRKFLSKILDYNNGKFCRDVWLIDWDNDCCDDVWTLRLGLELTDEEKVQLVQCMDTFKVLNPEKLEIPCENPYNESKQRTNEMKITMNENWDSHVLMAELVKIDKDGEETLKQDEVGSYEEAFDWLADYILDAPDMDDCIKEEYADMVDGYNDRGKKKILGWIKRNGKTHEHSLRGGYELELKVYEEDPGPDDTELEDYYNESRGELGLRLKGVVDVEDNPEYPGFVDVTCKCPWCKRANVVTMDMNDWKVGAYAYDSGELIQDAFPTLGDDEREMLKTGICDPCWQSLKSDEDEEY